jgi:hypothetical protein
MGLQWSDRLQILRKCLVESVQLHTPRPPSHYGGSARSLYRHKAEKSTVFYWVSDHTGLLGHEAANTAAEEAALHGDSTSDETKQHVRACLCRTGTTNGPVHRITVVKPSTEVSQSLGSMRNEEVLLIRLRIGHTRAFVPRCPPYCFTHPAGMPIWPRTPNLPSTWHVMLHVRRRQPYRISRCGITSWYTGFTSLFNPLDLILMFALFHLHWLAHRQAVLLAVLGSTSIVVYLVTILHTLTQTSLQPDKSLYLILHRVLYYVFIHAQIVVHPDTSINPLTCPLEERAGRRDYWHRKIL